MWFIHSSLTSVVACLVLVTSVFSEQTSIRSDEAWFDSDVQNQQVRSKHMAHIQPKIAGKRQSFVRPRTKFQSSQTSLSDKPSSEAVFHHADAPRAQSRSLALSDLWKQFRDSSRFKKALRVSSTISRSVDTIESAAAPTKAKLGASRAMILGLFVAVVIVLAMLFYKGDELAGEMRQEAKARRTEKTKPTAPIDIAANAFSTCEGTWAKTYVAADDTNRPALELVYFCSIIPAEEFAHSIVSQRHIDESIWIASQMLQQKPLAEWVCDKIEAKKVFEESVTACYTARTHAMSNISVGPESARGSRRPSETDQGVAECWGNPPPTDLVSRCREIMKESDSHAVQSQTNTLEKPKAQGPPRLLSRASDTPSASPSTSSRGPNLKLNAHVMQDAPPQRNTPHMDVSFASTVKAPSMAPAADSRSVAPPSAPQPAQGSPGQYYRRVASSTSASQPTSKTGVPVMLAPKATNDA